MVLEIAVSETEGRPLPIGENVEVLAPIGDPWLWEAVTTTRWQCTGNYAAGENRVERRCRQLRCKRQGSGCGDVPMHPEIPDIEGVESTSIYSDGVVILSTDDRNRSISLRLLFAVNVCRKQAVPDQRQQVRVVAVDEKLDGSGIRLPIDHFVLLQRINGNAVLILRPEIARGEDVGIGPHPVLG